MAYRRIDRLLPGSVGSVALIRKHGGPGPHEGTGTPQSIHAGGASSGGAGGAGPSAPPAAPTIDHYRDNPQALADVKARTRALLGPPAGQTSGGSGTETDPFITDDVNQAADWLAQGYYVELNQPREVSTLLDRLVEVVQQMKDQGQNAPNFDLCRVSVRGTNLFCAQHLGIKRINMPQFSGKARPGSPAEALVGPNGEANVGDEFVSHLQEIGVAVSYEREKASYLRASQMELIGAKVAGIANAHESGAFDIASVPIFVSRDNYVIDGHHRWAALIGVDLADNVSGDLDMPIIRVDMPITEVLREANRWTAEFGILPKAAKRFVVKGDTIKPLRPRIDQIHRMTDRGTFDSTVDNTVDVDGVRFWKPERVAQQDQIITQLEEEQYDDGREPLAEQKAIVVSGLPGAGKSFVMESEAFASLFDAQDYLVVAPDDIKGRLIDLPGTQPHGLDGLEAASLVHDEASMMARAWADAAMISGTNLLLDMTGSEPEKFVDRVQGLVDAGYEVSLVHVAVRPEVAHLSAVQRFSRGSVSPEGGRPVPEEYFEAQTTAEGASTPDQAFADAAQIANGRVIELAGAPVRQESPRVARHEDRRGN